MVDWKFTLASIGGTEFVEFNLSTEDTRLGFYYNKRGIVYVCHKKPLPLHLSLVFQLIGKHGKMLKIPITTNQAETNWAEKYSANFDGYIYVTGSNGAIDPKEMQRDWKLEDGYHHLRLTITGLDHSITIIVEGREIEASKEILMSQSQQFTDFIQSNMAKDKENMIILADFDYDVIKALVDFLHSETFELDEVDIGLDLLAVADTYGLLQLKNMVEEFATQYLTKETASKALDIAKRHNANKLFCAANDFLQTIREEELETFAKSFLLFESFFSNV